MDSATTATNTNDFAGAPTLEERANMLRGCRGETKCGFLAPSGYDELARRAKRLSASCEIVTLTAIFGSKDKLQQPEVVPPELRDCYFAFVDEASAAFVAATAPKSVRRAAGEAWADLSRTRVGAWQLLTLPTGTWPYREPRRASRVPKLLPFRLFPRAKHSVWVDGKLKLLVSPASLVERFLLAPRASLALPRNLMRNHLDEEARWIRSTLAAEPRKMRPKEAAAFEAQWRFYIDEQQNRSGGRPAADASDGDGHANKEEAARATLVEPNATTHEWVRRSSCAEGALILTDLQSPLAQCVLCAWFNEWHRFGERDQLSFSYVLLTLGLSPPLPSEDGGSRDVVLSNADRDHAGVYLWPRSEHWHYRKRHRRASGEPKRAPYVR